MVYAATMADRDDWTPPSDADLGDAPDPIARRPRAKRRLRFAVSTALLVGPLAVAPACGPQETGNTTAPPEPVEERINVPPDEVETSNPVEIEEPPPEPNTVAPPEPGEVTEAMEEATEEPAPEGDTTATAMEPADPRRPMRTNVRHRPEPRPMPTMNPAPRNDDPIEEL